MDNNETVFVEMMQLLADKKIPLEMMYFYLGSMFCRIAQTINRPIGQVLADIELSFKSLPEPIEEIDEQPNE
jgi:tagatose-1,6-bisphosphate aldolase non-catalytic subunit AgaZ/GatZ